MRWWFVCFVASAAAVLLKNGRVHQDPVVETLLQPPECSCDCCVTAPRSPTEVTGGLAAAAVPVKCDHVAGTEIDKCPETCVHPENMLQSQFCLQQCRPAMNVPNARCLALESELAEAAEDAGGGLDGDAARVYAKMEMDKLAAQAGEDGDGAKDGGAKDGAKDGGESDAEKLADVLEEKEKAEGPKVAITYRVVDLKDEIAKRKAAEGQSVAVDGDVADARAKLSRAKAEDALEDVDSNVKQVAESVKVVEQLEVKATEEAVAAQKDEEDGKADLAEVKAILQTVAPTAAKDAIAQVTEDMKGPVEEWGKVTGQLAGWDKPDFWPRVMAAKKADPYNREAVAATARVAEYTAAAEAARGQAAGILANVKNMKRDLIVSEGLQDERKVRHDKASVSQLKGEAAALEAKASQYDFDKATAKGLIKPYMDAAATAAVRSNHEFAAYYKE